MKKKKSIKVYELFWNGARPTCESKYYPVASKRVTQVAAVSLKQAMYLASHDKWYEGIGFGILSDRTNGSDSPTKFWDGKIDWDTRYKHGKSIDYLNK